MSAALGILLFVWLPTQYVVPVLMYHSVTQTSHEPLNNVTPASFDRQMTFFKKHGYRVLSVGDYIKKIKSGEPFFPRSVVITFDDGFEDNYTQAFPVLKKYGFPATIFVPSANVGKPGRLTWDQVRELSSHQITIGSHLDTEAYLPDTPPDVRVKEIAQSKKILEAKIGQPVLFLAYPIGGFTDEVKAEVQQAGYAAAFTTNRGYDRQNRDLYELKRIRIKDDDNAWSLRLKASGYYNLIRKSKKPY